MANERLAQAQGQDRAAQEFHKLYEEQKRDSEDAKVMAQSLEKDSAVQSRKALYGEMAELFLEVSIVLCSVALLTDLMLASLLHQYADWHRAHRRIVRGLRLKPGPSRAITTVVQELLNLGRSRLAAMRIDNIGRSPRMIGQ